MVLEIFTVYLVMFILQCFVWNLIKFALSVIWILFYLEEDYDVQKLVLLAVILQHRLDTDFSRVSSFSRVGTVEFLR